MDRIIELPVTDTIIRDGETVQVTNMVSTTLVENERDDEKLIKSSNYLPDFQRDMPVFKDATALLDILISDTDDETLKQIYEAYCDTLYKWPGYSRLSYGAKITLLQEKGFDYILDLLLHMYDDEYSALVDKYNRGEITEIVSYDEFVKENANEVLTKVTGLFNLINALKGKTLGLELVLSLVDMPEYLYLPWNIRANYKGEWEGKVEDLPLPGEIVVNKGDCYSKTVGNITNYYIFNGVSWHICNRIDDLKGFREPNTAILEIYGASSADLQKKLSTFVKSYMLPLIDVTLRFSSSFDSIKAYPSGVCKLLDTISVWDYYDNNDKHQQHDLQHSLSDEAWYYTDIFPREQVNFGTAGNEKAFDGSVDLSKSYVEDSKGVKHSLYGTTPTVSEAISGPALSKINKNGTVTNYDGTYLQVPLEDYVEIDIVTGNQQNPHYDGDEFIRDTLIQYYKSLTIDAIHLAKTCEQVEEIHIEDFDKVYDFAEVYLGKSTDLFCEAGKNHNENKEEIYRALAEQYKPILVSQGVTEEIIDEYIDQYIIAHSDATYYHTYTAQQRVDELLSQFPDLAKLTTIPQFYSFDFSPVAIREKTGVVGPTRLAYCENTLDTCYTGIGDLGILGANDYFIYNGMLLYHGDIYKQVGKDKTWTDIGASHAVSETYYTPGVNNGKLYYVYKGDANLISRDKNQLDSYISHIIKHPQIEVGMLDVEAVKDVNKEKIRTFVESWFEMDPYWDTVESTEWTCVTGYINDFYTAFGICAGRLYKLYKNPEFGKDGEPFMVYQIMDDEQGWTDLTGAAYSKTYEAYGIKNGKLYRISADGIIEVKRTDVEQIKGVSNVTYTEADGFSIVYKTLVGNDTIQLETETIEEDGDITYEVTEIKRVLFNGVEEEYSEEYSELGRLIRTEHLDLVIDYEYNLIMATINTDTYESMIMVSKGKVDSFYLNERPEIEGWADSYECISRYHHCNKDYTTYGICKGVLYAITDKEVIKLDETRTWDAICGFYNANSPRTFAYGISEGKLYELQGTDIVLKDSTMYWVEIHGCTTATNNFVLGLAKTNKADATGYIYKINAKTLAKLDNNKWQRVFGRYTTSTSASNNCYGYAVRNNRLYQITKSGIEIVSGFWKVNGSGAIVDLRDYNITNLTAHLDNGVELNGITAIKEVAPAIGTILSDYDIYSTYTTRGFDNNTRYTVRTEISEINYTYIHPEECRSDVSEAHCQGLFNDKTGEMTGFIQRNFELVGSDIVDGNGHATRFMENATYIQLPDKQAVDMVFKLDVYGVETLLPAILDSNNKSGIFYGKQGSEYGIFLKYQNTTDRYTKLLSLNKNELKTVTIKYIVKGSTCDVYAYDKDTQNHFESNVQNSIYKPSYLGGNGSIFGDPTFYLAECYYDLADGKYYLFENGKYFSLKTQKQDLIEVLTTDETQATQKVIEVIKPDNSKVELSMDTLYSMMTPECVTGDLKVTTDYNVNRLASDPYEGVTKATLTYSGAYELDPEVITSNIPLNRVCDFDNTGIAEHLNESNKVQFKLSTDFTKPIYIKSGSVVDEQYLFETEEGSAYTNKYLLESRVTSEGDVATRTAPSGIIYELNTDKPSIVSRTLTYNNDYFEIDGSKVSDYSRYWFDEYEAMLHYYPQYEYDEEYITQYVDKASTIYLNTEEVEQGGKIKAHKSFKFVTESEEPEEFMDIDLTRHETLGKGTYYYNFDIEKQFVKLNDTWLTEIDLATIEKDKLHYADGQCWNYSLASYHKVSNLAGIKGLVLCVITDDDTSKDQGIFGGVAGFGIKDNKWTYTDKNGVAHKSDVTVIDNAVKYIAFRNTKGLTTADIYVSDDKETWTKLFSGMPIANMILGKASVAGEMLPFNGTIDLAQSYIEDNNTRLYIMHQTTAITISEDGKAYREYETLETDYAITYITVGHHYTGRLDMFYSKLLKSYELGWVEYRQAIDDVIKGEMQRRDPSYNPDLDENTYGIEEYGLYLEGTPKRWDTVTVTYTTVDRAYYMKPNTNYTIWMDVEDDTDSGKAMVSIIDEPTWDGAVVSGFDRGHVEYTMKGDYLVLKLNMNTQNQAILGYTDPNSQCIYVQGGKVMYYDDINTHELFQAQNGVCYLKLPTSLGQIEYSFDGVNYTQTGVETSFTSYDSLMLGCGFVDEWLTSFKGSIDLANSYSVSNDTVETLFQYYKKVIPYISDGKTTSHLTLEPLLTVRDYVVFARAFNGQIDMDKTGLILPNSKYWEANQITIYKDGKVVDKVIRDKVEIEPIYTTENKKVRVNPTELHCFIDKVPKIGSKIVLTYNTWYLFREKNTEYQFKITYAEDKSKATISYCKTGGEEYTLYITEWQDFTVNTGYQFNGTLSIVRSTRGGMKLCDYNTWFTYSIIYRKHTETEWTIWKEFILERTEALYERCGYELLGTHYLETSLLSTNSISTPFVSFYNNEFIKPHGSVSFAVDQSGIVSGFKPNAYLEMLMDKIKDGYTISFWVRTGDNADQDMSTFIKGLDGKFITTDMKTTLNKFRPNYYYIVQYIFGGYGITVGDVNRMSNNQLQKTPVRMFLTGDHTIVVRILGYNVGENPYKQPKEKLNYITIIPCNYNKKEDATGYYITTQSQANEVSVTYRKVEHEYDHHTEQGQDKWYPVALKQMNIDYFGKMLNVYAARVPFGYTNNDKTNNNPDGLSCYIGDAFEFKVKSGTKSYNTLIPYNNIIQKQRAIF